MDDPVTEIPQLIHDLTQSPPQQQLDTLNRYFTPTASFNHPLVHTGSWNLGNGYNSRWVISRVYRWYKIMSPRIVLRVDGVAVEYEGSGDDIADLAAKDVGADLSADSGSLQRLVEDALARDGDDGALQNGGSERRIRAAYASVRQTFGIWFVPFYRADIKLVVRLSLLYDRETQKYYITHQEDCYPLDEVARFAWLGLWRLVLLGQIIATFMCVILAAIGLPVTRWEEKMGEGSGGSLSAKGWTVQNGKGIEGFGNHGHRNNSSSSEKKKSR